MWAVKEKSLRRRDEKKSFLEDSLRQGPRKTSSGRLPSNSGRKAPRKKTNIRKNRHSVGARTGGKKELTGPYPQTKNQSGGLRKRRTGQPKDKRVTKKWRKKTKTSMKEIQKS